MPLKRKTQANFTNFNLSLDYRVAKGDPRLSNCLNVWSNEERLDTRFGSSRFNTNSLGGKILSISYFKKSDGSRYVLAKVGSVLYLVSEDSSHTVLKSGLSNKTKHRGLTFNDRHIVSMEGDGLFVFDGETFTTLGQPSFNGQWSDLTTFAGFLIFAESTASTAGVPPTPNRLLSNGDKYRVNLTLYSSSLGIETVSQENESNQVTIVEASGDSYLNVEWDAGTFVESYNPNFDKVRVYIEKNDSGNYFLYDEFDYTQGVAPIWKDTTSTLTPPETNNYVLSGGGKYMTIFNNRFVYCGNDNFKNDVFFSQTNIPDFFDLESSSTKTLFVKGNGPVTGIATGFFSDSSLDPYLAIFKKTSIDIYSEIGGNIRQQSISTSVGCVSHDTIQVKNGDIYFLSDSGWRVISNGTLVRDKTKEPLTLGVGAVDQIFQDPSFDYAVNKSKINQSFSAVYPTLNQYMTFIPEGSGDKFKTCYVYEWKLAGFKKYDFGFNATDIKASEDLDENDIILISSDDGYIYKHSTQEGFSDVDSSNVETAINSFADTNWLETSDHDASYNFRELILRAINNSQSLTVKALVNFNKNDFKSYTYSFNYPIGSFILDSSRLDEDYLADSSGVVTARNDINRVGENIMIGFYQNSIGGNIGLISAQLDHSKNGNRN